MKNKMLKTVAELAVNITKTNVNSVCVYWGHQDKLPPKSEKLKK